jgi:putative inorganic carbon (hco3(-)) transporter
MSEARSFSTSGNGARTRPGRSLKWALREKPYEVAGILALLVGSVAIALLSARLGVLAGALVVGLWAIPVVIAIVTHPRFGIVALILLSFFLFKFYRLGIDFPLGTLLDGIQALLFLGFFIHQKSRPDWQCIRGPIGAWIAVWVVYNLLEVVNPVAESRLAWLYTVRAMAIVTLTYFVFMYQIRTVAFIRFLLKLWLLLAFVGAAYAFKQEYFGFSASEEAYLNSDPLMINLLFIDGHWRKYSIFSDPVAFSYNMVTASLLCLCLLRVVRARWKQAILLFLMGFYLFAMLFSGTRGAYVLIPAGLGLYCLLNLNRNILIMGVAGSVLFLGLIFMPTSNSTLHRFQSAFKPTTDASFNLRAQNQKLIQPFIQSHPFGGGLGATGTWGRRFSPNSSLANFPPDSGYVRTAVELGWVGLLIFCILMFVILKTGVQNFYKIRNPELKAFCLAMTLIVFALNVGNYPQEALVQYPSNILFYLATALINITYKLDQEWQSPT